MLLSRLRCIRERSKKCRPVGNVHAVKKPAPGELIGGYPEKTCRGRRCKQNRSAAATPHDNVGGVLGQKPIAAFFDTKETLAGTEE